MIKRWLIAFSAAVVLVAANRVPPPWEKSRAGAGEDLFREHCAVCHEISKPTSRTFGKVKVPNLYHAFKKEKVEPGILRPLNRQYIMAKMKFGGPVMPKFGTKLTDAEINTLIDYIETK